MKKWSVWVIIGIVVVVVACAEPQQRGLAAGESRDGGSGYREA